MRLPKRLAGTGSCVEWLYAPTFTHGERLIRIELDGDVLLHAALGPAFAEPSVVSLGKTGIKEGQFVLKVLDKTKEQSAEAQIEIPGTKQVVIHLDPLRVFISPRQEEYL